VDIEGVPVEVQSPFPDLVVGVLGVLLLGLLDDSTRHMTRDDGWADMQAGRDFVVDATVVALRPTRLQGVRLKLQNAFAFASPTLVAVSVGDDW
jgi:hypothetical protein